MLTKLDQLLESIHPQQTLEKTAARAAEALNSFDFNVGVIEELEAFKSYVTRFYCHVENTVLRLHPPLAVDPEFHWSEATQLFKKE